MNSKITPLQAAQDSVATIDRDVELRYQWLGAVLNIVTEREG